jgi:D-alanine-D-alanine ligase
MKKINKHIEIVRSSIIIQSSMSQPSCDALLKLLSKYYTRVGVTIVDDLSDLKRLTTLKPDVVFLGMQSIVDDSSSLKNDNKIWLSQYFDNHGITYTGSTAFAHKLEKNKSLAKKRVLSAGLNTAAYYVSEQNYPLLEISNTLKFPLFVKPTDRGGGLGINSLSVVRNFSQLQSKVLSISQNHGSDSLIEEYLEGREFSVAIMRKQNSDEYFAMPLELIAPEDEFGSRLLSESVKNQDTESFVEIIDLVLKDKLATFARDIFSALNARDYGRIDIRLNSSGEPQFLEANLIPSLIEGYGNFPKACFLNESIDYKSMVLGIVSLALERNVPSRSLASVA